MQGKPLTDKQKKDVMLRSKRAAEKSKKESEDWEKVLNGGNKKKPQRTKREIATAAQFAAEQEEVANREKHWPVEEQQALLDALDKTFRPKATTRLQYPHMSPFRFAKPTAKKDLAAQRAHDEWLAKRVAHREAEDAKERRAKAFHDEIYNQVKWDRTSHVWRDRLGIARDGGPTAQTTKEKKPVRTKATSRVKARRNGNVIFHRTPIKPPPETKDYPLRYAYENSGMDKQEKMFFLAEHKAEFRKEQRRWRRNGGV